jgi:hypothetical protein
VIKPPSLQGEFDLVFSEDPALDLPADDAEKARVLKVARETGKWPIKPGEAATLFRIEPLTGLLMEHVRGEMLRRKLTEDESRTLIFRLGVKSITHAEGIEITYSKVDRWRALSDETTNAILSIGAAEGVPEVGRAIVNQIGLLIWQRSQEPVSKN